MHEPSLSEENQSLLLGSTIFIVDLDGGRIDSAQLSLK